MGNKVISMSNKIKFKILDKYEYKDTYTIQVYRSIGNGEGHYISDFNEAVAEMNRRQGIANLNNTRFTFEDEGDMIAFMLTWGSI